MIKDDGKSPSIPSSAFTIKYDGPAGQLISEAIISNGDNSISTRAQWDTGASGTCIASELAEKIGLVSTGKMMIHTPSGNSLVDTFLVGLSLPNHVKIGGVPVCGTRIGEQGIGVLIGMDIIRLGDFCVSNCDNKTWFSFRMPSESRFDFVKELQVRKAIGPKHGSGKRNKKSSVKRKR